MSSEVSKEGTKKRFVIIGVIACIAILGVLFYMRYDEKSKSMYVSYSLKEDNTYEISGYNAPYEVIDRIEIPSTYKSKQVTAIKDSAFRSDFVEDVSEIKLAFDFKKVVIPNTIKTIGKAAFAGNPNMEEINIPEKVDTIKEDCFRNCINLKKVDMSDNVKKIEEGAFYNTKLDVLFIPKGVETMGKIFVSKEKDKKTSNCKVLCECKEKPSGWDEHWNDSNKGEVLFGQSRP